MLHQNPVAFIQPHLYAYVLGVSIPYPMTNFPKQSSSFYTTNSLCLTSNPVTEFFYCPQCSETYLPFSYVLLGYTSIAPYVILNVFPSWPPLDFTGSGLSYFCTVYVYTRPLTFSAVMLDRAFLKLCLEVECLVVEK